MTAAAAVAEPRCGFQDDWDCQGPPVQRAVAEYVVARLDVDAATLPRRRQPDALPVLRPAAMSDERRGASGGFGGAFVLLIFVGAIVKFWVWIAVAFGAAMVFGLLLWAAFYAARWVDAQEHARLAIAARADRQHAWVLAGDDRGIYGDYVPTQID